MSPRAATASFPSSALACADSELPAGDSLCGVAGAADVNSLNTWLGTVVGTTISSWLADGVPEVTIQDHPP